jgi:tetratricopeptide (TPR) repeat protein
MAMYPKRLHWIRPIVLLIVSTTALMLITACSDLIPTLAPTPTPETAENPTILSHIEKFNKEIDLDPSGAYYNRGIFYFELDQNKRAIEDFDKAVELNPSDGWAYRGRGISYEFLG